MSKHPVKKEGREVPIPEADNGRALRIPEPDNAIEASPVASPFFSFSYSYSEITLAGGTARVKSKKTQFEDGKVTSEAFEGTLDSRAYHAAAKQAEELFVRQTRFMLDSFFRFLPWGKRD
jgi:hypothetical protein